jgi:magnesium chelatase family protein
MPSKVTSIGLKGLDGYRVTVEVQAVTGINSIVIVGLPDVSVKESKQRITAAFHALGYFIHTQKMIVNLSPAEQKKNGPLYDLPIAIGILARLNEIEKIEIPETTGFIGSLSLDGSIHAVEGMLAAVLAAKKIGLKKLYLPFDENLPELDLNDIEIIFITNLTEIIEHLSGKKVSTTFISQQKDPFFNQPYPDFEQIFGHTNAKYAFEVAAAGEHHLFMSGPPGCGKSMLAESFPSILPPLKKERNLEMISIYQLSGLSTHFPMVPPFRNPHHSSSGVSIIGGGQTPKPGEISLAHHGVLFLDEMAEFPKKTLDMLRQPFETGSVTISRARSTVTYPASFILIGAMNPCPCGYFGSKSHYCTCSPRQMNAYQNRLSGPLRDRFDIFLSLAPVDLRSSSNEKKESSKMIRQRVKEARLSQYSRYGNEISIGRVSFETLLKEGHISNQHQHSVQNLAFRHNWSNRTQIKIIRLARTIADLQQKKEVSEQNIWDAVKLHGLSNDKHLKKIK